MMPINLSKELQVLMGRDAFLSVPFPLRGAGLAPRAHVSGVGGDHEGEEISGLLAVVLVAA